MYMCVHVLHVHIFNVHVHVHVLTPSTLNVERGVGPLTASRLRAGGAAVRLARGHRWARRGWW